MKPEKPVAHAIFGHHEVPHHYFVTPRRSGLPADYFRTWRDKIDIHDVVAVLVVLCFIVGLVLK